MPGGRNCCPGKGTEAMVGGTVPEGLRAGREVRCPDRMPGTRLGPETRMRKATRRTGPEQGRNTTQRRGTRGGGVALSFVGTRLKPT